MVVDRVPALVTLHVWGVPSHQVPTALLRMGLDRRAARTLPGARFAKLLGTADGATFAPRDADARHWALVTSWDDPSGADRFTASHLARAWAAISEESLEVRMHPLASRGTWSRREPFGRPRPRTIDGPVAALTRARVRPRQWRRFRSAVPPVAADLRSRAGVLFALGIGEMPIGLQGTFSVWSDDDALRQFAHRGAAHRDAVAATDRVGWYSEELFARFAVERATGSYRGRPLHVGGEA